VSYDQHLEEPSHETDGPGWGAPALANKWHWFETNGLSLCGRWLFHGPRERGDAGPDCCRACAKKLAARKAKS
jgi:hypothetical protein